MSRRRSAFTLIEILVVVVILGVLSAIVVPQFNSATEETRAGGTYSQLIKLRNALDVYYVREGNVYPNITAGVATWGELLTAPGYLQEPPMNVWVGSNNAGRTIVLGNGPDAAWQNTHGWIYDNDPNSLTYGKIWAGGFDASDIPHPKP
jgi:type II secretion system protein G